MHRVSLVLSIWALLAASVAALASLARPDAGPPMPEARAKRSIESALVPEREIQRPASRVPPAPSELSGTVAPSTSATQDAPAADRVEDAVARPPESADSQRGEELIQGLGPLPRGVPAEEEGLGVHVLRADGSPASGADVRWMQQSDLDRWRAAGVAVDDVDPDELLRRSERSVRAGSNGFAMLTSEKGTMVVDARVGDQYGHTRLQREETGHVRIQLHRDSTLAIQTIDDRGAPHPGLDVVLRTADCRTIWRARSSAPDGRAVLRHADGFLAAAGVQGEELLLSLDAPDAAVVTVSRGRIPVDSVHLARVSGATVRVRVEGPDGAPCIEPTRVRIALAGREPDCRAVSERETSTGEAEFRDVPAGARLLVSAGPGCGPREVRTTATAGAAGEVLSLTLRHPVPMPRVTCRLVDGSGAPRADWSIEAFLALDGKADPAPAAWTFQSAAVTGQDGAARLDLPAWDGAHKPLLMLVARNAWGRVTVSSLYALGAQPPIDLGEVDVTDWPVLVRGVVVDGAERPLEGAWVELVTADGGVDRRTRTRADAQGRYQMRGPTEAGDVLLLRATEPAQRAATADLAARRGDRSARIVIAVHGSLGGRVLLPDGAPDGAVLVRVEPRSGPDLALTVDHEGRFEFSQVEPGECRVTFLPQGYDEAVFVLDGVTVPRGGAARDERLAAVDLRALVTALELEIVDERGNPIQNCWVGPPAEGRPRGRMFAAEENRVQVLASSGAKEVQVFAEGYEPALVPVRAGRQRVELVPLKK